MDATPSEGTSHGRVLVVDDDPGFCATLALTLGETYFVEQADGVGHAVEQLARKQFDVVVTDYLMPDGTGATLAAHVAAHHPGVDVIVLTAHTGLTEVGGLQARGTVVLFKPIDPPVLLRWVRKALDREAAARAARLRAEVLASMSHELRTPLNAVVGMAELLLDGPLSGEQRERVETIRASGRHLTALIEDVLHLSRIEAGAMRVEPAAFDLLGCVEEALDMVAAPAGRKGLALAAVLDTPVPPRVLGDAARLRQVLANLLSNAVKFTAKGEVVVRLGVANAGPGLEATIAVTDTGPGIPADQRSRLFRPFSQLDGAARHGGSGLGLAISRRLCELLGGSIGVESAPGAGSTFRFTVALGAAPAPLDPPALAGRRLLVASEHGPTRRMLEAQLARLGAEVVGDPAAAADAAVVDADSAAPALAPGLPRVFVRSLLTPPPAGPSLTKPVKSNGLREAVLAALGAPPRSGRSPSADRSLRVLVAEDNEVNRRLVLLLLQALGHHAHGVADGPAALEALASEAYDVVLMDIHMPRLDGLATTREIVRRWGAARPRVLALTASVLPDDQAACLAAGMDDFVPKPFTREELAAALARASLEVERGG